MPYKDKRDQAAAAKRHYDKNKDVMIIISKFYKRRQIEINQKFILSVKRRSKCVECNNSNPIVLEFDHVRGKKAGNIADMVRAGSGLERIIAEIEKCDIVCANCHRIRTWRRRMKNKKSKTRGAL